MEKNTVKMICHFSVLVLRQTNFSLWLAAPWHTDRNQLPCCELSSGRPTELRSPEHIHRASETHSNTSRGIGSSQQTCKWTWSSLGLWGDHSTTAMPGFGTTGAEVSSFMSLNPEAVYVQQQKPSSGWASTLVQQSIWTKWAFESLLLTGKL